MATVKFGSRPANWFDEGLPPQSSNLLETLGDFLPRVCRRSLIFLQLRVEAIVSNTWRSYSTKGIYRVYLKRRVIPKWSDYLLSDVRTIEVESWLRGLPVARRHLRQDPQRHVSVVQSRLSVRILRSKPD